MKDTKIRKLTFAALSAAIIFVGTYVLIFPLPGSGYANLGDCFIITVCCFLGVWPRRCGGSSGRRPCRPHSRVYDLCPRNIYNKRPHGNMHFSFV